MQTNTTTDLSILLPSIRWYNLQALLDSIEKSYSGTFELIVVGPNNPADCGINDPRVKFVKDFGSPSRCENIALEQAVGKLTTWAADDGIFLPNGLNLAVAYLLYLGSETTNPEKTIVTCKYFEGPVNPAMAEEAYYMINNAGSTRAAFIPNSYYVLNLPIMYTNYLKSLGGLDSMFETTAMAHIDLAVRAQRDGAIVHLYTEPIFSCSHMPDVSGDHAPIHHSQIGHDEPLFRKLYSSPECVNRIKVDSDNWKAAPAKWARRFA